MKGSIDTLPKDHIVVLYRESPNANPMCHTGLYIGNDIVVDARGSKSGVITSKLATYPWTHWAIPKGLISYAEAEKLKNEIYGGNSMASMGKAKVTGKKLALRVDMSTKFEPLARLETGEIVDILEKTNVSWWKVRTASGLVGYVMTQFVMATDVTPSNPSAPDNSEGGADEIEDNQHIVHLLCRDEAEANRLMAILKSAVFK